MSILLTSNLKYFQSESWYSRDLIRFLSNLKWYGKQEVTVNHANAKQISVKASVVRCTAMTCSCSGLHTLIVSLHVSLSSLIFCCCCCDFHFAVDTRASSLSQWGSLTSKDLWASSPAIVPHKSSSLLTRLVQWHQKILKKTKKTKKTYVSRQPFPFPFFLFQTGLFGVSLRAARKSSHFSVLFPGSVT